MAETILTKLIQTAKKDPARTAVRFPKLGQWLDLSWGSYRKLIEETATGLSQFGIASGDHVAIFANTRVEWAICDLAIMSLGGVTIPIYQNSSAEDLQVILQTSGARILICDNATTLKRFHQISKANLAVEQVICFDKPSSGSTSDPVLLEQLQSKGREYLANNPSVFEENCLRIKSGHVATILFTSGTTGQPKGVVLTHEQIWSEVNEAFPLLGVSGLDRTLCFLPFAHILGRIEIWGHLLAGFTMCYAESIEKIKSNLAVVEPTIMLAVPRIFEKIFAAVMAQSAINPIQNRVFNWALAVGAQVSERKCQKRPVNIALMAKYEVADRLVLKKIREAFGGKLRFAVCGGAPLSSEIAKFFHACDILILEGYGLTETTAAICVNTPFDYKFGTVGKPIGDVKLKIADDGEIMIHSRKVMREYYRDPQGTAAAVADGWLRTGDIGEISSEGYLRITDRKKDLIKTAGGKYVAPQKLEALFKAHPLISHVHVHGDQKKFIVCLITLSPEGARQVAIDLNLSYKDFASLSQNPQIREKVRLAVAEVNSHLASFESIKNFAVLTSDFTVESGELTPSLKTKRKVIDKNYQDVIDKLYGITSKTAE